VMGRVMGVMEVLKTSDGSDGKSDGSDGQSGGSDGRLKRSDGKRR